MNNEKTNVNVYIDKNGIETIDYEIIIPKTKKEKELEKIRIEALKNENKKCGYIYIVYNPYMKLYKIGSTKNYIRRLRHIELSIGRKMKRYFLSEHTKNYVDIEIATHHEFQKYRTIGEWFKLSNKQAEKAKEYIINRIEKLGKTYKYYTDRDINATGTKFDI